MTLTAACSPATPGAAPAVVARAGHDTSSFTQGLQVAGDVLVETTGRTGRSRLNVLAFDGATLRSVPLPADVFGEGVAVADGTVWVLTWRDGRILRYTWPALEQLPDLPLDTEGWGVCHDGTNLWTSDGSATLTRRDPATGDPLDTVRVVEASGRGVSRLNELDCAADGTIWANVWQTDRLVRIDPATGVLTGGLDLSEVSREAVEAGVGVDGVANGVASAGDGRLWVTGKGWPLMFLVEPGPAG